MLIVVIFGNGKLWEPVREVVPPLLRLPEDGLSLQGTKPCSAFFWLGKLPAQGQHSHYAGSTASSCFKCTNCGGYK